MVKVANYNQAITRNKNHNSEVETEDKRPNQIKSQSSNPSLKQEPGANYMQGGKEIKKSYSQDRGDRL